MFEMVDTAFKWGMDPEEFMRKSPETKAVMMQYLRSTNRLEVVLKSRQARRLKNIEIQRTRRGR
jgi:hypothetical protein